MCVCISAAVSRLYSAWQAALRDYCHDNRVSATDGALCIKTDGFYLDVMGLSDGERRRCQLTRAQTLASSRRGWSLMSSFTFGNKELTASDGLYNIALLEEVLHTVWKNKSVITGDMVFKIRLLVQRTWTRKQKVNSWLAILRNSLTSPLRPCSRAGCWRESLRLVCRLWVFSKPESFLTT